MRYILIAALLALGVSYARAETVTTELTTCTTEEAMVEYTKRTWGEGKPFRQVLADMNKNGEVCRLAVTVFEPGATKHSFVKDGITYQIVEITTSFILVPVADGVSVAQRIVEKRYAMRYFREVGKDA